MPIGSGDTYQVYRNRYKHIIEPAVEGLRINDEQVFRSVRADFVTRTGSITRDLLGRLYHSDVVIADLTDLNPNVFYELGVRHALRAGTILIALRGTKPPFDVGDLRVISYEDRIGGEVAAIPQLQEILQSLLVDQRQQDSPVLLALPELAELGAVKEYEAHVALLQKERDILKAQLEISEKLSLKNQAMLETLQRAIATLGGQLSDSQRRAAETQIASAVNTQNQRAAKTSVRSPRLDDVVVDPDLIFVLMPLSPDMEPIFELIRDAAIAVDLRCYRADSISAAGSIIDQIFESIAKSGLIVADLTGRNQNVMYEIGLANAMGKKTLLLAQHIEEVPFDVRQQRVLVYDRSLPRRNELRNRLIDAFMSYRKEVPDGS